MSLPAAYLVNDAAFLLECQWVKGFDNLQYLWYSSVGRCHWSTFEGESTSQIFPQAEQEGIGCVPRTGGETVENNL